jgi:hypothetical protein
MISNSLKFRITLVRLDDNQTRTDVFDAVDRYAAVAKAFLVITGQAQHDCLDEWKVLACDHIIPDPNLSLESALDDLKAVISQGALTAAERQAAQQVLNHCSAALTTLGDKS